MTPNTASGSAMVAIVPCPGCEDVVTPCEREEHVSRTFNDLSSVERIDRAFGLSQVNCQYQKLHLVIGLL